MYAFHFSSIVFFTIFTGYNILPWDKAHSLNFYSHSSFFLSFNRTRISEWKNKISENGIGFAPEYNTKIQGPHFNRRSEKYKRTRFVGLQNPTSASSHSWCRQQPPRADKHGHYTVDIHSFCSLSSCINVAWHAILLHIYGKCQYHLLFLHNKRLITSIYSNCIQPLFSWISTMAELLNHETPYDIDQRR